VKAAQIDMRTLYSLMKDEGEEEKDVTRLPGNKEVVTTVNVSTCIKKRELVELVRAALPHEEQVKFKPSDEVTISKISFRFPNEDGETISVSWLEEEFVDEYLADE